MRLGDSKFPTLNLSVASFGKTTVLSALGMLCFIPLHRSHSQSSVSQKNTTLTMHAGRPALVMENGSPCKAANGADKGDNAVSILSFICDSSVYGTGTPLLTGQWPPHDDELACVFFMEWRTHVRKSRVSLITSLIQTKVCLPNQRRRWILGILRRLCSFVGIQV